MSKYAPLHAYLAGLTDDRWRATIADVETILGFPLPDSAHTHAAWWANSKQSSAAAWAWLDQGWRTEKLDLVAGRLTFWRVEANAAAPNRPAEPTSPTTTLETIEHVDLSLCLDWLALGAVTIDEGGRLAFPTAAHLPAIYRFTIRHPSGKEARYVGEAADLARRFGNYRTPGPTQQTSLRINATLKEALASGSVVSVAAVVGDAWIDTGDHRFVADLHSKVVRCLLENAAIITGGGADIEMLNKAG